MRLGTPPLTKKNSGYCRRQADFDLRAETVDDGAEGNGRRIIRGHGSIFNAMSEDLGGFREIIHTGAFDRVLASPELDVRGLVNHQPTMVLGRTTAGTLRLSTDATGLAYECDLPDTSYARDLAVNIDNRNITQSSFAFDLDWEADDEWDWEVTKDDQWVFHVKQVRGLFDVSPVTYPAYRLADVRSVLDHLTRTRENRKDTAARAKEAIQEAHARRQRELKLLTY